MANPIVFCSDFGLADEYVGVCHSVIARISPDARVIDLTHGIPPQDVLRGAVVLAGCAPYLPEEAVILAVVDPGVGTERRAVAVRAASGRHLVGPDNGLLAPLWRVLGGAVAAVEIASAEIVLEPRSHTFHGRDMFSPAAAHLAAGLDLGRLGPAIDPASLVSLELPAARVEEGVVHAAVIGRDRFGNLALSARQPDLESAGLGTAERLRLGAGDASWELRRVRAFGEAGASALVVLTDSLGWLAVAVNGGSAADALAIEGREITLQAAGG